MNETTIFAEKTGLKMDWNVSISKAIEPKNRAQSEENQIVANFSSNSEKIRSKRSFFKRLIDMTNDIIRS